jgi:hypothetical protein
MSVQNLIVKDDPINIMFSIPTVGAVKIYVANIDGTKLAELVLDRSQAHLLMLWLQEHLK